MFKDAWVFGRKEAGGIVTLGDRHWRQQALAKVLRQSVERVDLSRCRPDRFGECGDNDGSER
jgi:hypothetical protein